MPFPLIAVIGFNKSILAERHDKGEAQLQCGCPLQHDRAFAAPAVTVHFYFSNISDNRMKTELVLVHEDSSKGGCVETDSSLHKSDCQKQIEPLSSKPMKKRIGPFSFYLHDVIGRGFSSVVYRGIRDNDKAQQVALKVITLEGMSSHRRLLLEN